MTEQPADPGIPTTVPTMLPEAAVPATKAGRKPRRWLPVIIGVVTFLVVLVTLFAAVGDWALRNVEMRALVTKIESSEQAMSALQAAVGEIATAHDGVELSDADRAAIAAELRAAAASARDAIEAAGEQIADVHSLPWHSDIRAAQAAYLAHNRAWQAYLDRATQDIAEFDVEQTQVNETFAAAEEPIRDAVPEPAIFDVVERIDVIFAPPPSSGGPTQDV